MGSAIDKDLERGIKETPSKQNQTFNLLAPSTSSTAGKKNNVKQVTEGHNTELHLAAQRGDLASVKHIFDEIRSQVVGDLSAADFDAEVSKIRASMMNKVNGLRETPLYIAAENGHLEVVKELLKYSDKETLATRNRRLEFDTLHIAASQGHHDIVKLLLDHDVSLCQTRSQGNATPLITAASKGHTAVVEELLSKDPSLLDITRSNGKNALHLAAKSGHVETVKCLLAKDPQLARRTDKKGQTALHMAVKGANSEVIKLLLEADAAIAKDPQLAWRTDKKGKTALHMAVKRANSEVVKLLLEETDAAIVKVPEADGQTALHMAARSGHVEIVKSLIEKDPQLARRKDQRGRTALHMAVEGASSAVVNLLLCLPDTDVNAINRDLKTALDIAREANPFEEIQDIQAFLVRSGAVQSNELNRPVHEWRNAVSQMKWNVNKIAIEVQKLREIHNSTNSTNSFTVAVLFATISFASLFTVPGGEKDDGTAVAVNKPSFQVFLIFNALALYTSLAVVLIQTTMIIRGKTRTERRLTVIINWLIWLASVCTSVAFMATSYIVMGRKHEWGAIFVTICGGTTMVGVFIAMPYYTAKVKRSGERRKRNTKWWSTSVSFDHDDDSTQVEKIYAL